MAFRVARNYCLIRLHTPDGEVRWSVESDKSKMPTLAEMRKTLNAALAMLDNFEGATSPDSSAAASGEHPPAVQQSAITHDGERVFHVVVRRPHVEVRVRGGPLANGQPAIYPCGCSKHKVNAGFCDQYAPNEIPGANTGREPGR